MANGLISLGTSSPVKNIRCSPQFLSWSLHVFTCFFTINYWWDRVNFPLYPTLGTIKELDKHPAGCGIARVGASTCWKKWQPFQCFVAFWSGKKCSQKRSFFLDFATLTAQISDLFCLATFIDHCACRPHWLVIWWVIILTIWKIAIIPSISNNDQHMKLEGDFYHHWDELYRYRGERHYQQKYGNHYKLLWCTPQNR